MKHMAYFVLVYVECGAYNSGKFHDLDGLTKG